MPQQVVLPSGRLNVREGAVAAGVAVPRPAVRWRRRRARAAAADHPDGVRGQPGRLHHRGADSRGVLQGGRSETHRHGTGSFQADAVRVLLRGVCHAHRRRVQRAAVAPQCAGRQAHRRRFRRRLSGRSPVGPRQGRRSAGRGSQTQPPSEELRLRIAYKRWR
eukprot:ctg_1106.g429